tara:strand:- start:33 stop:503 length:471 start_codon:yes stop_codon:yes gene_type:complete
MPNSDERRERFIRVSQRRVKKAISSIESVNALTGNNYKYENDEIVSIFTSLYAALDTGWLTISLKGISNKEKVSFLLEREISQYENIKALDPDLYEDLKLKLPSYVSNFIEDKNSVKNERTKVKNLDKEIDDLRNDLSEIKKQIGTLTLWYKKNDV